MWYWWVGGAVLGVASSVIGLSYVCYRMAFRRQKKKKVSMGPQFDVWRETIRQSEEVAGALPYEDVYITSREGLKLHGRYYETRAGAPVQIMFHGYRSYAIHDYCGGLRLALKQGFNALLVDQRAHGESEGKTITFGVKEREDCLLWTQYIVARCGGDTPIVLSGISMGAATVLMATALPLPPNVVGVIADCGYSSPREIIRVVIRGMGYPVGAGYFFVRLGAKLFGGFDVHHADTVSQKGEHRVPILIIHGEDDRFVPCEMGRKIHAAYPAQKTLMTIPEAGHGLSYMVAPERYVEGIEMFLKQVLPKGSIPLA